METSDPLAVIAEAPVALSRGRMLLRARRQLKWDSYDKSQEGRTTTVAGFIDWGPTGTDSIDEDGKSDLNVTLSTRASTTTVATTTSTTTRPSQRTFTMLTTTEARSTTKQPNSNMETVKPPKPYGETSGKTNRTVTEHDFPLSVVILPTQSHSETVWMTTYCDVMRYLRSVGTVGG